MSTLHKLQKLQTSRFSMAFFGMEYKSEGVQKYVHTRNLGEGSFGVVWKAFAYETDEDVAVKEMHLLEDEGVPSSSIREISIIKGLEHPNIVRIKDVQYDRNNLYLLLECLDMDLKTYMMSCPLLFRNPDMVKELLRQLLEGVAYCHSRGIIHRDLKPENLLVNTRTNTLKIADFGLARSLQGYLRDLTPGIVTLWYRAPEVLLQLGYRTAVDVWSVGCIFAEMVIMRQLFEGYTESRQLDKIFSCMGTPNENTLPGCMRSRQMPKIRHRPKDLRKVVPDLDEAGLDLLSKMLILDPRKRITARSALTHWYFYNNESSG